MKAKSLHQLSHHPASSKTLKPKRAIPLFEEAHFIRSWFVSPAKVGAVSPSGRFLARAMARCIDLSQEGVVVELGPGTGPVTEALLAHGVAPNRLVLIEFDAGFCELLRKRFPGVTVIQGDAYNLKVALRGATPSPIAAIVSSLPLLNRRDSERIALLNDAFEVMGPNGLLVQFTYGPRSPIPLAQNPRLASRYRAEGSPPIWLNLPPARVWRYMRKDCALNVERLQPRAVKSAQIFNISNDPRHKAR